MMKKTNLKIRLKSTTEIDDAVNLITSNIQTSAWESTLPPQPQKSNTFLPVNIRVLIAQKRWASGTWQRTKYLSDKCFYNGLAQKLKRLLAIYRNESYTKYLTLLIEKDGHFGRQLSNFFEIEILLLFYATIMVTGHALMKKKQIFSLITFLILFNCKAIF